MRIAILFFLFSMLSGNLIAQQDVTTLGLQLKPIIPSKFFGSGPETVQNESISVEFIPELGWSFGMVIRTGITDHFSIETGINLVRRNFKLNFNHLDSLVNSDLDFAFAAYEIPLQGLYYVRLSEDLWMNASGGVSVDLYPSEVFSNSFILQNGVDYDFEQLTVRKNWVQIGLLVNYGFEYRTKDKGFFYLGASYHRPFTPIATTEAKLKVENIPESVRYESSGSYLTFDIRYFFHEDPERKKKVKKGS